MQITAYKVKKRHITLIEIMIVMFLIALITGVIAYNYRGTLEEGKAFKTRAAIEKLETILSLEIANHPQEKATITTGWKEIIERSPLVHDPKALEKDGWGNEYQVEINPETDAITVTSNRLNDYEKRRR